MRHALTAVHSVCLRAPRRLDASPGSVPPILQMPSVCTLSQTHTPVAQDTLLRVSYNRWTGLLFPLAVKPVPRRTSRTPKEFARVCSLQLPFLAHVGQLQLCCVSMALLSSAGRASP